jgi:threonine/homoserine/homoserine lactone efflux protein
VREVQPGVWHWEAPHPDWKPGEEWDLVLQNGLARGRRAAVETAVGINASLLVWAVAAALGIAALLRASAPAFMLLKLAGAAYLVWLGMRALSEAGATG